MHVCHQSITIYFGLHHNLKVKLVRCGVYMSGCGVEGVVKGGGGNIQTNHKMYVCFLNSEILSDKTLIMEVVLILLLGLLFVSAFAFLFCLDSQGF